MPGWVLSGYREYEKRLPRELCPSLIEIAPSHRSKNSNEQSNKEQEGKAILSSLTATEHVVALDVKGKPWSTEEMAEHLSQWQMNGKNISFVIGGPYGISQTCLQRADQRWSLSNMTLPHPLVRVVFIEQLYRAWSILTNHPYHK